MVESYLGHDSQIYGVEEHRLVGGTGDGMRLLQVRNGKGLEFTISADRCSDISRVSFQGANMGFFSPCGYVAPQYYDPVGKGFLKSFTAGFLTTCGRRAAGAACQDEGEDLPMHGTISHKPAQQLNWLVDGEKISISAKMYDAEIFGDKLALERTITCSLEENTIELEDCVRNIGDRESPLMLLYHFNMGYPLLSETAKLHIPSDSMRPRDREAEKGLSAWDEIIPPQPQYQEQCFYHTFEKEGRAGIFNPKISKGLVMSFDPRELDCFTQWKMMGTKDYVMGLEPGNCYPDGRDVVRREGKLKWIHPNEEKCFRICLQFLDHDPFL